MQEKYDAIIIGSGIGGLSCASLLAQLQSSKVLVLERHFTAGGYTHMFERQGRFEWDVGLHYVGEMYEGSRYRNLFDFVTDGQLEWTAMPDTYDCYHYPDFSFGSRRGFDHLGSDLKALFPRNAKEIDRYFRDVILAAKWFGRFMLGKLLPVWLEPLSVPLTLRNRHLALMTTANYLDTCISNPQLRGLLASQWGDYGLPPHLSSFGLHAVMVCHMQHGGFYPVGGAKAIAGNILPIIESRGGTVLLRHEVTKIITDGNRAAGVEVRTRSRGQDVTKRFDADLIISDAGYITTFNRLLPQAKSIPVVDELAGYPDAMSQVCVYLGFKQSPACLGLRGENHWIYTDYNHSRVYELRNQVMDGRPSSCFASFPSLKDPHATGHTAELITFLDFDPFRSWSSRPWKKRGPEYDAIKNEIADSLIDLAEQRISGLGSLIEYREVSTPLSIQGFTGHRKGSVYGIPGTPERFASRQLTPRTRYRNLFMTGVDIAGPGIVGGLMSGFMTALVATERKSRLLSILRDAQRQSVIPARAVFRELAHHVAE